ncbi:MAG: hypothetical protein EBX37_05960 [Alphaproteobacteria bacterium]|nr:hypothetical protein [Alphaproteobacteria bacterium]
MPNITAFAIWAALLGAGLLSIAIWQFAPSLGTPFDTMWLLSLLVTIPLLVWGLVFFLVSRRAKKRKAGVLKNPAILSPQDKKAEAAALFHEPAQICGHGPARFRQEPGPDEFRP